MYARCTGISIQRNLLRQMQFAVALAHAFAFIHANVKCVLLACQLFTSISLQSNVLCLNTSVKLSSISALSSHDITLQYTHYRTGINSDKVRTTITDTDGGPVRPRSYGPQRLTDTPERPKTSLATAPQALKIFQKDVEKYDATPGCRACTEVITGRANRKHAITQKIPHNQDCRARMPELMRNDEIDKHRVNRAEERQTRFREEIEASKGSEAPDEPPEADQEEDTKVTLSIGKSNLVAKVEEPMGHHWPAENSADAARLRNQCSTTEFQSFLNNIQVGFALAIEEHNEVSEVYSVPRVTKTAKDMGLKAGWALDICTRDDEGQPWDFTKPEMRNKAARKVIQDSPLVLIGSPPCTDWSSIMNLNWSKMSPQERKERQRVARTHVDFCVKLYRIQIKGGRYFLHEHPNPYVMHVCNACM